MRSKLHFSLLVCGLSFVAAALFACEDNPEECYSDKDCGEGYWCEATYYNTGSRSGGICHEIEKEEDGGDNSEDTSADEASAEASVPADANGGAPEEPEPDVAVSGDAAPEAPEMDGDGAVDGGRSPLPADSGNVDSAN